MVCAERSMEAAPSSDIALRVGNGKSLSLTIRAGLGETAGSWVLLGSHVHDLQHVCKGHIGHRQPARLHCEGLLRLCPLLGHRPDEGSLHGAQLGQLTQSILCHTQDGRQQMLDMHILILQGLRQALQHLQ